MFRRILKYFCERKWFYALYNSKVRIDNTSDFFNRGKILDSFIFLGPNSRLIVEEGAILRNVSIYVNHGSLIIGRHTRLIGKNATEQSQYIIDSGNVSIGHHSLIKSQRIWVRFGGILNIGDYTNLNNNSEVRADESVNIGDYCQISYNVRIWDTNTHSIYNKQRRRQLTEKYWPYFGMEIEKPMTKPVNIGNDCWIGENASVLKGSIINDQVIIGFNTLLINKCIESNNTVVSNTYLKIIPNK